MINVSHLHGVEVKQTKGPIRSDQSQPVPRVHGGNTSNSGLWVLRTIAETAFVFILSGDSLGICGVYSCTLSPCDGVHALPPVVSRTRPCAERHHPI